MRAYSNTQRNRWIYGLVLALFVLPTLFGGTPQVVRGQSETPPPPQIAPAGQGGDGELSAQCTPPDEPPAPKLVAPASGSTLITITPTLSWKGNSTYCIKYYNIQIWVAGGPMVLSAWPTTGTFTVPAGKLTWGTKYNWYVWAYNIIHGFGDPLIASFTTTTVTNDDFNFATAITTTPYSITESTTAATTSTDDPVPPCGTGQGHKSVWWRFTPNSKGTLDANTIGSDYNTLLAVWTGTRGALVNAGCNDDVSASDNTSALSAMPVTAGKTYYIEVIQSGDLDTGGSLHLSVVFNSFAVSVPFTSVGAYDGWLLETRDGSLVAGTANAIDSILIVGNTPNGRRYRSFLSFNTILPANAVIISAVVNLRMSSITNPNPLDTYAGIRVDIRKPYFGTSLKLQLADFNASSSLQSAGSIPKPATPDSVYSASLLPAAFKYINRAGTTQFRLRFPGDDIGNDLYNTIKFYSGNTFMVSMRPTLVVTYYIP